MPNEKSELRLSPLNNLVFACIFKDENSKPAMLEFLNAVLNYVGGEPISEIIDIKSEYSLLGESKAQKHGRLDVRVKGETGRLFDIEVQIEQDYMNERGYFYGGRMVLDEFESGTPYNEISQVCVINITDFYVRDGSTEVVEPVELMYTKAPVTKAMDAFTMYHIQLPEFRKNHKTLDSVKDNPFFLWLYMFDNGYKSKEEMNMLAEMSAGIRNFAERYGIAINDPDLIRRYRMEMDWLRDERTRIAVAENRGREEGEKKGREEGIKQMVLALFSFGISKELIKAKLQEQYSISGTEADAKLKKYLPTIN